MEDITKMNIAKAFAILAKMLKAESDKQKQEKHELAVVQQKNLYEEEENENMTEYKKFTNLCRKDSRELKQSLFSWLSQNYDEVVNADGFLYARGKDPILLTAHMDTVHSVPVKDVVWKEENGKHIVSSPQGIGGDDRCGIYMIKKIVMTTELRPSILFCEDEEIGGIGSRKFCMSKFINNLKDMLFLIELDRANADDLVYYSDDNYDFHKFCKNITGYNFAFGSFSDISNLSPACGISSVNISCGYYKAHTKEEYVVFEEMVNSITKTIELIKVGIANGTQYKYEEHQYEYGYGYGYNKGYYGNYKNYGNRYGSRNSYYDRVQHGGWYDEYDAEDYDDDYSSWYEKNYWKKDQSNKLSTKVIDETSTANAQITNKTSSGNEYDKYYFVLKNGKELSNIGRTAQEAFGNMCFENKDICFNDIVDYYKADYNYKQEDYENLVENNDFNFNLLLESVEKKDDNEDDDVEKYLFN